MKPEVKVNAVPTADRNLMPSMVVRQQRNIQLGANQQQQQPQQQQNQNLNQNCAGQTLRRAPNPDESSQQQHLAQPITSSMRAADELSGHVQQQLFDQDGLVLPKRVLHHPVSVAQPIIRDLNRELKFNQIRGKNVLDQKSELKKALEKLEESKRKREAEQERLNRRTSLELRLEERAERLAKESNPQQQDGSCKPLSNFSIKSVTR